MLNIGYELVFHLVACSMKFHQYNLVDKLNKKKCTSILDFYFEYILLARGRVYLLKNGKSTRVPCRCLLSHKRIAVLEIFNTLNYAVDSEQNTVTNFQHSYSECIALDGVLLYSRNMIMSDLPEIYTQSPRAQPKDCGHTFQANYKCPCYSYYVTLPLSREVVIMLMPIRV